MCETGKRKHLENQELPQIVESASAEPTRRAHWTLRLLAWTIRRIRGFVVGLLKLLFVLWLLLKIPAVQNWIAQRAADFLSSQLDTRVEVEYVEFELFNKVILHGLYIEDQAGDTLLYAGELRAYIDLISVLDRQVNINRAEVRDAYFNYQRKEGEADFNLYFILRYLGGSGGNKNKKPNPLKLAITEARALNTRVHFKDAALGTEVNIWAHHAYVYAPSDSTHIPLKIIRADSVFLDSARVDIRKMRPVPIAESNKNKPKNGSSSTPDSLMPRWDIRAGKLRTRELSVSIRNELFESNPERDLDFNDLKMHRLRLAVDNFSMYKGDMQGDIRTLSVEEARGFRVLSLEGHAFVNNRRVSIRDFRLRTPYSDLGNLLEFEYEHYSDFLDFVNRVEMRADLQNSTIALRDIMAFAFTLKKIPFFAANADRPIEITGNMRGTVNNLRVRDLNLRTGYHTHIKGFLSLNDITVPDAGFMDLQFEHLQTHYNDLATILPFVRVPQELQRLGLMRFTGNYTGFFKDFVAFGHLRTDLGELKSDLKMDIRQGTALAKYSGGINLMNFDLGTLLNKPEFGRVSLRTGVIGQGLTLESLQAHFDRGHVDTFEYKGYTYRNVDMTGYIQNRLFNGSLSSTDPNCYLYVSGIADLRDTLPQINLRGSVRNVNFQNLNLTEEAASLKIDTFYIVARGKDLASLRGRADFEDVAMMRFNRRFSLDSIVLESQDSMRWRTRRRKDDTSRRDTLGLEQRNYLKLRTDICNIRLAGAYDMRNLPRALARYTQAHYPNMFKNLEKIEGFSELAVVDSLHPLIHQRFRLQLEIDSTDNLTQLIDTNFMHVAGLKSFVFFNSLDDTIHLKTTVRSIKYDKIQVGTITIEGNALRDSFALHNDFADLLLGDSTRLPAFNFDLTAHGDSLRFSTKLSQIGKMASNISINGKVAFMSRMLEVNIDTAHLEILGQPWDIRGDNYVKFGAGKLEIKNLRLTNGGQLLEVSSLGTRGISVCVEKMDLGWLYKQVGIPQLDITGAFSADLRVRDVFDQKGLSAAFRFDSLYINGDRWGRSQLLVQSDSLRDTINASFQHRSPFVDTMWVQAQYLPPFATKDSTKQNWLNIDYELKNARVYMLEYFLKSVLTNTHGNLSVRGGKIRGQAGKKLNMAGTGYLHGFETKLLFTNVGYALDSALINIHNEGFTLAPMSQDTSIKTAMLRDSLGRRAALWGGIKHQNLRDFELDLHFKLENNLVLNTSKNDNSTFYGRIYADGLVNFTGPFQRLRLVVDDAVTRDSSLLVLPLGDPIEVEEVRFLSFVDKVEQTRRLDSIKLEKEQKKEKKVNNNTGFSVEINTQITPSAAVKMIFDERTGEIMEGQGDGFLRLTFNTAGEFGMFGDFTLTRGSYLFTYQNLINKVFSVRKGGTITWTGSPYDAQLDIQAEYKQQTGISNLISTYLETADENTRRLANKPTPVGLLMNVRGLLFSPDITFDIDIPETDPQLRSFTDLALKAVRENTSELNRQVFALIALQQFLPLENTGRGQNIDLVSTSVNTLSELVSRQLTAHLNDILKGVADEVGFISSFEIDVNLNMRDQANNDLSSDRNSNLGFGLDQTWFDNRMRVRVGANLDLGTNMGSVSGAGSNYIGGDFIIEYNITEDGRFKIRGYNRTETNVLGRVTRMGIGLSYRKEFNTFGELLSDISKDLKGQRLRRAARKAERKARKNADQLPLPTDENSPPPTDNTEPPL